jgi:hypothetical protein
VQNEQNYFGHLDAYLSDVFEWFTALYTRDDPTADVEFDLSDEMEPDEEGSMASNLTRH